jgi:hypothetical protein
VPWDPECQGLHGTVHGQTWATGSGGQRACWCAQGRFWAVCITSTHHPWHTPKQRGSRSTRSIRWANTTTTELTRVRRAVGPPNKRAIFLRSTERSSKPAQRRTSCISTATILTRPTCDRRLPHSWRSCQSARLGMADPIFAEHGPRTRQATPSAGSSRSWKRPELLRCGSLQSLPYLCLRPRLGGKEDPAQPDAIPKSPGLPLEAVEQAMAVPDTGAAQRLAGPASSAESAPSLMGPIALDAKHAGERSAGKPHSALDVGAGNVTMTARPRARAKAPEHPSAPNVGAPVFDPTCEGRR